MEWDKEDVQWAFRIFMHLLKHGVIDDSERELHYAYKKKEVYQILEEIMEKEADVKIFSMGKNIFITPGVDNRFFGYKNAELRDKMKLDNNSQLYLAYFAILCLLGKFYNSEDQSLASRQFISLEELEETITGHVDEVLASDKESIESVEDDLKLNLRKVADVWDELPPYDDKLKNPKRGKNNRISFLLKVMTFLEDEELITIMEDYTIRLLDKLEHLVMKYYFHSERKERLLQFVADDNPYQQDNSLF